MEHLQLVRHLFSPVPGKAVKTIANTLGVTQEKVKEWRVKINKDGLFHIPMKQGAGLSIEHKLLAELDIYPIIESHIEKWVRKYIYRGYVSTKYLTKQTYKQKLTGKWKTPDFTTVCEHKFSYAAHSSTEVVSFEVKHSEKQFNIDAVYEALAHTRASNYSILFYYVPPHQSYADDVFEEIKFCCSNLGIGLVVTHYPCDIDTWDYIVMAERHSPDLRKVDLFLEEAFAKDEDRAWFKKER